MDKKNYELAKQLGEVLQRNRLYCVTAESCTGGGVAMAITEVPGSSQWFERGYVTYSNEAKQTLLFVPKEVLSIHGAVSEATACVMAEHAIINPKLEVSLSVTGIAGPSGGSIEKPVGTVWIAWAGFSQKTHAQKYLFQGDRTKIRYQAIQMALEGLIRHCESIL